MLKQMVLCCAVLCCAMLCCAERLYETVAVSGDTLLAVVQSITPTESPRSLMALNLETGNTSSLRALVSATSASSGFLGVVMHDVVWHRAQRHAIHTATAALPT
jgi:hypothetical protein